MLFISFLMACTSFDSTKNLAKAQELAKHYSEAEQLYSKVLEMKPSDEEALTNRGHCKYHLQNYKGAIDDFTKAIELNKLNGRAYDLKGLCEYRLKDYKAAINDFEHAITIDPNNAHTNEDLGNCYKQVNDLAESMSHLTKAKELYKKHGSKADIDRVQKVLDQI